jgi:hypothetical protein
LAHKANLFQFLIGIKQYNLGARAGFSLQVRSRIFITLALQFDYPMRLCESIPMHRELFTAIPGAAPQPALFYTNIYPSIFPEIKAVTYSMRGRLKNWVLMIFTSQ